MNRRLFLGALAALGLTACSGNERAFNNTDLSAGNIFPSGKLLGADGRPRDFSEFRGKVSIVFFGYTSCPDICPTALRKYASLVRNLRDKDAERLQVIFVSVDPERDTPEKADTYAKWFNPGFIGLSGSTQQIADFAAQFKVIYSKQPIEGSMGYVIDHTSAAYVIDPKGQLRLMLADNALLEPIGSDLQQLLNGK